MKANYRVSERHVCKVLEIGRTTYRYEARGEQWTELRMRMREIAQTRVRYGYRMIRVLLIQRQEPLHHRQGTPS